MWNDDLIKPYEEDIFGDELIKTQKNDGIAYNKITVEADILVFTIEDDQLKIMMNWQGTSPYNRGFALPGVLVRQEETLDEAAQRAVFEETGMGRMYNEQMYTFGEVKRDPRCRVISVSYLALVPREELTFRARERTGLPVLVPVSDVLDKKVQTAFDHGEMIKYGKYRLKNKAEYTDIALHLVPELFTLPQLQRVYEILLEKPLFKANFRKKVDSMIEKTNLYTSGDAHRPSRYYIRKSDYDYSAKSLPPHRACT